MQIVSSMAEKSINSNTKNKGNLKNMVNAKEALENREASVHPHRTKKTFSERQ